MTLAMLVTYCFIAAFIALFVFCAIDIAFVKDFKVSENISSAVSLMAAVVFLFAVCIITGNDHASNLMDYLRKSLSQCMPFYDFVCNATEKKMIINVALSSKEKSLEFAEEFLQTVFMASMIPIVNKYFPTIIHSESIISKILMTLTGNIMVIVVVMIIYALFQTTAISHYLLNIILLFLTTTPITVVIIKLVTNGKYNMIILSAIAVVFGKSIAVAILYVFLVNELMMNYSSLVELTNTITILIPFLLTSGLMIFGIAYMIRSIFK